MERALSSNLISESVKQTRIAICRMAIDAASLSASRQILDRVLLGTWNELLFSIDFALSAKRWGISNPSIHFRAECVVALVIVFFQERDERWESLATDQLGISRPVLGQYLLHGDSTLLANFICIIQKVVLHHSENGDWPFFHGVSLPTIEKASRFDARSTLPELQHEFCKLWNRLVLTARNDDDLHTRSITVRILQRIRNIYTALHEDVDTTGLSLSKFSNDDPAPNQASLYPFCSTHNLYPVLPSPEVTAKTAKVSVHTPAGPPVLLQASESTLSASTRAVTVSQSPWATAVPSSSPLIQSPILQTPILSTPPAAHKLPSPSHPAPTSSDMHHIGQRASSGSSAIPSGSAHLGSISVYPTPTSSIPAPQTTSIPTPAMTARSTDRPAPAEAMG